MKNRKTPIIKSLFLLFLLLPAWFSHTAASNIMTISGGDVQAGETIVIEVLIDNTDAFVAFQLDIPLPNQLTYVTGSAELNPDRSDGHLLHADLVGQSTLRIFGFSFSNIAFFGNSGAVMSFTLSAGTQPGSYPLEPVNPIIANADQQNIITGAFPGTVTLLAPDIYLSTDYLDFGEVPLGEYEDKSITIHNHGNQALDVSEITFDSPWFSNLGDDNFVLAPGSSQPMNIRFTSEEQGYYEKTMTILSNDPDTPEKQVALEATAFAVNELHCGNMFSFSGTRDTLTLSINNMEEFVAFQFDLHLPSPLSYVEESVTLTNRKTNHVVHASRLPGGLLRVVAFSPGNQAFTGDDGDIVSLAFDVFGSGGWYPLSLSGVIIAGNLQHNIMSDFYDGSLQVAAPQIHSPKSIDFGDVSLLDTESQLLTIHNAGSDTLFIDEIITTNESFHTEQEMPVVLLAGQSFQLEIFYHNPQEGPQEGLLQIFSNDPDEYPYIVNLSAFSFSPNYLIVQDAYSTMNDNIFVEIHADNHEAFVALELVLHYPEHIMSFLPGQSYLTNRAQDHELNYTELSAGELYAFAFSLQQKPFFDHSGAVLRLAFQVNAPSVGTTYPLSLSDGLLVNAQTNNILYDVVDGELVIIEDVLFYCPDDLATCFDADPLLLSGAFPEGGVFSGPGTSNGWFDPQLAGTGSHTLNYTYQWENTYESSCEFVVTVYPLPTVTLNAFAAVYVDMPPFELSGGLPAGGSYSGTGVDAQGWFDPPDAGTGTHEITYTYTDENGCTGFATNYITVHADHIPETLTLNEHTIGMGENHCFDALEQIILAGNGGWFHIQEGGSAELIAGQSIHFLPGTVVDHGGYLMARIAQHEDDYCGIPRAVEIAKEPVTSKDEDVISADFPHEVRENGFFKLYPNPTDGSFTLELTNADIDQTIIVEVHSMPGGRLFSKELPSQRLHTLSLEGHQPGMYIIRVHKGDKAGVERLIKR